MVKLQRFHYSGSPIPRRLFLDSFANEKTGMAETGMPQALFGNSLSRTM
jgi:hypothetical protein